MSMTAETAPKTSNRSS